MAILRRLQGRDGFLDLTGGDPRKRRFFIIASLVVWGICLLLMLVRGCGRDAAVLDVEGLDRVIGARLGGALRGHLADAEGRVLAFATENQDNHLKGLKKALAGIKVDVVLVPADPVQGGGAATQRDKQLADFYNGEIASHSQAAAVVFFTPLPGAVGDVSVFGAPNPPPIAVFGPLSAELAELVEDGTVRVLVTPNSGTPTIDDPGQLSPEELFDAMYTVMVAEGS